MATPFDATTKELVKFAPEDWLPFLGLPREPCELIDADLATVSTEADRLIRVAGNQPYLVHLEFQAGHEGHTVPGRMLRYNVLASEQTSLSVLSFVILLRPEADSPRLTGIVERFRPDGSRYHHFEHSVIRLWQVPVDTLLKGMPATLPLALLCDLSTTSAEQVVSHLEMRIGQVRRAEDRRKLWASTYLLAGVRFAPESAGKLLEKAVTQMKESMTYQKILADGRQEGIALGRAEGKAEGERELLLRLARKRFGEPNQETLARVALAELSQLESWAERLLSVETWSELLNE